MSKKSTTNEFIRKARKIHGNKYNYSNVLYTTAIKNVLIICKKHGNFLQSPNAHLSQKQGCPRCGQEHTSNLQRKTTHQIINEFRKRHGNKYNYTKVVYVNALSKVIIVCSKHGEFRQAPR